MEIFHQIHFLEFVDSSIYGIGSFHWEIFLILQRMDFTRYHTKQLNVKHFCSNVTPQKSNMSIPKIAMSKGSRCRLSKPSFLGSMLAFGGCNWDSLECFFFRNSIAWFPTISDPRQRNYQNCLAMELLSWSFFATKKWIHQEFQVPKMEVLNLIRLFWGWVFPCISRIHTAYIGEYLHFRYLKCLVMDDLESEF